MSELTVIMKSYKNIIVLLIIMLGGVSFYVAKTVNVNELLLSVGYYDKKLTILNTTDIHGNILYNDITGGYYTLEEVDRIMGLSLMKYLVDDERTKQEDLLLIDSGDLFHGTNEANINDGEAIVKAVKLMKYDAMVAGNHDFNFGVKRAKEIADELNFPVLSANVFHKGKLLFKESTIIEWKGKKIGFFGLTTPLSLKHLPGEDQKDVVFEDPIIAAKRVVKKLKNQVDLLFLISHLGDVEDRRLVRAVDGIDLIFAGHFHQVYKEIQKVKQTHIVEAGSYTTHLGAVEIYFKEGQAPKYTWRYRKTNDLAQQDPEVEMIAQAYYKIAYEQYKETIGTLAEPLDGLRSHVRMRETNMANLLADSMKVEGEAEITLVNGGVIRQSIPKGEINYYDVKRAVPFFNSLVVVEMKGEDIHQALERGVRQISTSNGAFLQVSGLQYEFDGTENAGERVKRVTVNGKPLDLNSVYTVATNDFLYNGGDGYDEFAKGRQIKRGKLLSDVLAKYIKDQSGPIAIKTEERIKVLDSRYK